jgi:hypothetical protein
MADQRAIVHVVLKEYNDYLYPKNDYIASNAMFDAQGADSDKVTINESQEQPFIVENETVFPLPVQSTEDANKSYTIDTLRSLPTFVSDLDELLTVGNKAANEAKKHADAMKTQYYDKIAHAWALDEAELDSAIVRTTGSASTFPVRGDMTGSRKSLKRTDWINAIKVFALQEVPTEGLVALVDEVMYWDIYNLDEFILYTNTGVVDPVRGGGAIGELLGVRIYKRNGVPFYDNDATPALQNYIVKGSDGKYSRHQPSTTDQLSIMMWHPAFVRYSLGNARVYTETGSATLQGNLMSTSIRCGAMRSRIDNKGVVMIIQAT